MTHKDIQELTLEISNHQRYLSSEGLELTKNLIKDFAIKNQLPISIEDFNTKKISTTLTLKAKKLVNLNILTDFKEPVEGKIIILDIEKISYINTLSGYIPILIINELSDIEAHQSKINFLKPNAVIFCFSGMDVAFYIRLFSFKMPVFSIGYKDLEHIEELSNINIEPPPEKIVKAQNIYFDVGRGPIVYILSPMASKDESFGAIYSASSVGLALGLANSLAKSYNSDFKFRFFFTDQDNPPFDGIRHHLAQNPKYAYYAISLFNIGWTNHSCFYEDFAGESSIYMIDKFFKYLKSLNTNISFVKTKTMCYMHAPFREKDIKTLMLGANCTISNTIYDNSESIRFDGLFSWFDILSGFLRRFHAL